MKAVSLGGNQSGWPSARSNRHGMVGAGAVTRLGPGDIDRADGSGTIFQGSFAPTSRGGHFASITVALTNGNADGTSSA